MNTTIQDAIMYDGVARVSGEIEHLQFGHATLGLFGQLPPIDLRHDDIGEKQIMRPVDFKSFLAAHSLGAM
jgi:hypothetical protein